MVGSVSSFFVSSCIQPVYSEAWPCFVNIFVQLTYIKQNDILSSSFDMSYGNAPHSFLSTSLYHMMNVFDLEGLTPTSKD